MGENKEDGQSRVGLASKEGFLEETDKHHSVLELDGASGSPFPFLALLSQVSKKAVSVKKSRGSMRAFGLGKAL